MTDNNSKIDARKYLAAFADGELDVQDSLRVLEHMTMNPNATRRVMHQQQLRQMVGESVRNQVPAAPDSIRQMVENLPDEPASIAEEPKSIIPNLRPWAMVGVAAVLAIVVGTMYLPSDGAGWRYVAEIQQPQGPQEDLVEFSFANSLMKKHVTCTRRIADLGGYVQFPENLQQMPEAISAFLEVGEANCPTKLDLTAIGYEYSGAGPCSSTGGLRSIHMIYKPTDPNGPQDAISLWILPESEKYDLNHIKEGQVFKVTTAAAPHPIAVWRSNGMVYFVVGDSMTAVHSAADTLLISS